MKSSSRVAAGGCSGQLFSRSVTFDSTSILSSNSIIIKTQPSWTSSNECNDYQMRRELCASACHNGGTCTVILAVKENNATSINSNNNNNNNEMWDGSTLKLSCACPKGFKGRYCEHAESATSTRRRLSASISSTSNECPAKWWGRGDQGLCGPCECDESKNFSPDCNKTTGQCYCKPKFYKKV